MGFAMPETLLRPCARSPECSNPAAYYSTLIFTGQSEDTGANYSFGTCGMQGGSPAGCGTGSRWSMDIWPHQFGSIRLSPSLKLQLSPPVFRLTGANRGSVAEWAFTWPGEGWTPKPL